MSDQHTPGPWIAYVETVKEDRRPVCLRMAVQALDEDGPVGHIAFSEANARLIAAAPDMLASLKLLLRETELSGNAGSADYGWPTCVLAARAAIAKAEGRS